MTTQGKVGYENVNIAFFNFSRSNICPLLARHNTVCIPRLVDCKLHTLYRVPNGNVERFIIMNRCFVCIRQSVFLLPLPHRTLSLTCIHKCNGAFDNVCSTDAQCKSQHYYAGWVHVPKIQKFSIHKSTGVEPLHTTTQEEPCIGDVWSSRH